MACGRLRSWGAVAAIAVLFVAVSGTRTTCVPVEPVESVCVLAEDCAAGEYCAKAVGDCGGEGRCAVVTGPCVIGLWAPQCGCDGETYGNPCEASGLGVNVAYEGECRDCDPDVIGFPQDNPRAFEFYEVCVPRSAVDPQETLRALDPTLYCGVAGGFAGCDREREVGCHGDLAYIPGTRHISGEKWRMLCALSVHPLVVRMGGGHFVR